MNFEIHTPTPLQHIQDPMLEKHGITLHLKRDDLIHSEVSGNKWRKLKYNILQASKEGKKVLLSFGGAYSNHIYAVAAAGKYFGFETIGIIRGEETFPLNPTLSFAKECGMKLVYESRSNYKIKETDEYIHNLKERFGHFYHIPEGGTNPLALEGVAEVISEIEIEYSLICCPCGSGGTIAGLIKANNGKKTLGISVLKGAGMLDNTVAALAQCDDQESWRINYDYHFGGYAKITKELILFIQEFERMHQTKLEPIYSGKMMYALYDLIKKGNFKRGESIIALHTGGLQALQGLSSRIQKLM